MGLEAFRCSTDARQSSNLSEFATSFGFTASYRTAAVGLRAAGTVRRPRRPATSERRAAAQSR